MAILRAHSSIGSAELPLRLRETWDSDSGWWHERTHGTVVVVEVVLVEVVVEGMDEVVVVEPKYRHVLDFT